MKSFCSLIIYVFSLAWFPACSQKSFDEKMASLYQNTVPLIQPEELKNQAAKNQQVYLLDTRAPKEYLISHLPGARLVNYDEFDISMVSDIPRDASVIVYCSVGYRSERIGEKLQESGFKQVRNLYGGIFNWKNKGYEIMNSQNQPTDSVHTYNRNWSQWLYNGIKVYE